jgi:hypothetical protein
MLLLSYYSFVIAEALLQIGASRHYSACLKCQEIRIYLYFLRGHLERERERKREGRERSVLQTNTPMLDESAALAAIQNQDA